MFLKWPHLFLSWSPCPFAIWFCITLYQEMESISPPFGFGFGLIHAQTNGTRQKLRCASCKLPFKSYFGPLNCHVNKLRLACQDQKPHRKVIEIIIDLFGIKLICDLTADSRVSSAEICLNWPTSETLPSLPTAFLYPLMRNNT